MTTTFDDNKKANANHKAYEVWQDARKSAAGSGNIEEWQRLHRAVTMLNNFHPLYKRA